MSGDGELAEGLWRWEGWEWGGAGEGESLWRGLVLGRDRRGDWAPPTPACLVLWEGERGRAGPRVLLGGQGLRVERDGGLLVEGEQGERLGLCLKLLLPPAVWVWSWFWIWFWFWAWSWAWAFWTLSRWSRAERGWVGGSGIPPMAVVKSRGSGCL